MTKIGEDCSPEQHQDSVPSLGGYKGVCVVGVGVGVGVGVVCGWECVGVVATCGNLTHPVEHRVPIVQHPIGTLITPHIVEYTTCFECVLERDPLSYTFVG